MSETESVLRYAAFTDAGRGGNPAGVVLDAGGLDDAARLRIAAEVGYSETAFIEPAVEGHHRVRFFSPVAEVAFCGHATVAAAVAITERHGPGPMWFDTAVGVVPVDVAATATGLIATLTSVPTRTRPASDDELDAALAALRWNRDDLDGRFPPHVSYAGNEHLVLAVHDRQLLADLEYDYPALDRLMRERGWTTAHLVWSHEPTAARAATRFSARDPFPPGGVVEDPATGAAAAAFGGYLRALGLVDPPAQITIHQGEDMGRPSLLMVDVRDDDRVWVSGSAATIAR
ncbi:MAG: PhzF family phenazine biosynthesis protein [Angustibacter sp.]